MQPPSRDQAELERHARAAEAEAEQFIRAGSFKLGRIRLGDAVALRAMARNLRLGVNTYAY